MKKIKKSRQMIRNNNVSHVCFDLDGTLIDSSRTIYLAAEAALRTIGIKIRIPKKIFYGMIGKHFIDIFSELKINVPDFSEFIAVYKSVYFDFIDISNLYPNVNEVFSALAERDIKTSLLTTKAQDQAEKIVKHFSLNDKLDYIMGRREGIAHKPSAEPLLKICDELNVSPQETLIVGDTELDIQCGKKANAGTCAVLHGYRTKEQIAEEKPDYIISRLDDLRKIIESE